MIGQIVIGSRKVTYELIRKNVKNINLRIRSDLTITVSANPKVKKERIEEFLIRKSDWIEKSLQHYENYKRTEYRQEGITDGDSIRLLGKDYVLKVIPSGKDCIELQNGSINIYTRYPDNQDKLNRMWGIWFEAFTRETLYGIVSQVHPLFKKYSVDMPAIKLRYMKTRWGSCTFNKGTITLNKALIHTPEGCIEYVAAHELTHFLHPDHSKNFYNMLFTVMPDYKERKKILDQYSLH